MSLQIPTRVVSMHTQHLGSVAVLLMDVGGADLLWLVFDVISDAQISPLEREQS